MAIKRNIKGFTLIEVVLYAALLAVIALFLPRMLNQINKQVFSTSSNVKALDKTMSANHYLERFLKQAKRSTVTISQEPGQPTYSKIEYTEMDGTAVQIYQKDSDLLRSKGGKVFPLIKNGLNRIAFTYPDIMDDSRIQVTMSAQKNEAGDHSDNDTLSFTSNFIHMEFQ